MASPTLQYIDRNAGTIITGAVAVGSVILGWAHGLPAGDATVSGGAGALALGIMRGLSHFKSATDSPAPALDPQEVGAAIASSLHLHINPSDLIDGESIAEAVAAAVDHHMSAAHAAQVDRAVNDTEQVLAGSAAAPADTANATGTDSAPSA